jgi:hypothetical protein
MGYSFLNFVDAKFIQPFYEEMNAKKWEKFNSEKVCQISYARIQGRAHLEQHFRDSSVMNQNVRAKMTLGCKPSTVYDKKHRRTRQKSEK